MASEMSSDKRTGTEHVVLIGPEGTARFLYHDDLVPLMAQGEARTRRASHVEPTQVTGNNFWWADMAPVGGPDLGPFLSRAAALAAEVAWLTERDLPLPLEVEPCR